MRSFFVLLSTACCVSGQVGSGIDATFREQYQPVVDDLVDLLESQNQNTIPLQVRLTWHTMAQYNGAETRVGGSNGGCQRFNPERDDPGNAGLDGLRNLLEPIYVRYSSFLTRADLYILAGNTALEIAGSNPLRFRPGRVDFSEAEARTRCPQETLRARMPIEHFNADDFPHAETLDYFHDKFSELEIEGTSEEDMIRLRVALMGGHTLGGMHRDISGRNGRWTRTPFVFNNEFYRVLVNSDWDENSAQPPGNGNTELQYVEGRLVMLPIDIVMKHDARLFAAVQEFANNENLFKEYFTRAWEIITSNGVHFLDAPAPATPVPTPQPTAAPQPTPATPQPAATTPQPTPATPSPQSDQDGEGLKSRAYAPGGRVRDFPDYNSLEPIAEWVSGTIDFESKEAWQPFADVSNDFATRHFGYIQIDTAGEYTFATTSDDGSRLFIDGQQVVDNGGTHAATREEGTVRLAAGLHTIDLQFFERNGDSELTLQWRPPRANRYVVIPASVLRVAATDFPAAGAGTAPTPTAQPTPTPTAAPTPTPTAAPPTPTTAAPAPVPVPPTGSVNLALNKPATSSATMRGGVAPNAVDGDADTQWVSWTTGRRNPAWLTVELGAGTVVTGWTIEFSWRSPEIEVRLSEDCENWTVVFEGTPSLEETGTLRRPMTARCISIVTDASRSMRLIAIDELTVY